MTAVLEKTGLARFEEAKANYPKPRTDPSDWSDQPTRERLALDMLRAFNEVTDRPTMTTILGGLFQLRRSDYDLDNHVAERVINGRLQNMQPGGVQLDAFHWSVLLERVFDEAQNDDDGDPRFEKLLPAIRTNWVNAITEKDLFYFASLIIVDGVAKNSG